MSLSRQLREQIDACRPGKDDLALPALAELAAALPDDASLGEELARSQKFDSAVTAALTDLPVPQGLAERLLAAAAAPAGVATTNVPERRFSRRAWSYAAASAAAVLFAGSLGMWLWPRSPRVVTADDLAADLESMIKAAQAGRPSGALPGGYTLPAVLLARPLSYQRFTTRQGWPAIAVNLSPPAAPAATLLVIRSRAKTNLPAAPRSISASGGKAAFAWQQGGFVYVLVIDRGLRMEDYLAPPRQA